MYYADDRSSGGQTTYNTAVGCEALRGSTTASANTGQYNTAVGDKALYSTTGGHHNTGSGYHALYANTSGNYNTAFGFEASVNNSSGDYNTAIGYNTGSTLNNSDNTTAIGNGAQISTSNRIILGNTSVTWIGGHSLWNNTSDARMKNNIKEEVVGLDFILKLRPVTYNFDKDKMDKLIGVVDSSDYPEKYDIEKIVQSGFLAQEVEQAANDVGYDFSGVTIPKGEENYYSLEYAVFVVPLVKAVQELKKRMMN